MRHFQIPLNLPHAGRICLRLRTQVQRESDLAIPAHRALLAYCNELLELLLPYTDRDDNPEEPTATRVKEQAAELGREFVDTLVEARLTGDWMGQCVRNLFECLEMGEEGARISLRAGENPDSLQRP